MRPVIVRLAGLLADGQIYKAGQVVQQPGPELLALAKPGVLLWTGVNAADYLEPETRKSKSEVTK